MQRKTQTKSKDTDFEYRLFWTSSFVLVAPTLFLKRLLPTQWHRWKSGASILTVVKDARETSHILAGMAYKAF